MLYFTEGQVPLWFETIYYIVYVFVFFFILNKINQNGFYTSLNKRQGLFIVSIFTLFAVFYFMGGDYYSYLRYVNNASEKIRENGLEFFYQRLAYWCNGNNDLFRLIVWGSAIFLVYLSALRIHTNTLLTVSLLFLLFYDNICYARASLGMAVYYMGLSLILTRKKNIIQFFIGIAILISSLYFHRSMIILIALTPFALLIPLKKKSVIIVSLCIIIATVLIFNLLPVSVVEKFVNDASYSERQEHYAEAISQNAFALTSIKSIVNYTMKYLIFYIPFIIISKHIFVNRKIKLDKSILNLYRITFTIIIISAAFFITFGGRNVYFYRILYMSMIPISIMLSYFISTGYLKKKESKGILYFCVIYFTIAYFVSIYNYYIR